MNVQSLLERLWIATGHRDTQSRQDWMLQAFLDALNTAQDTLCRECGPNIQYLTREASLLLVSGSKYYTLNDWALHSISLYTEDLAAHQVLMFGQSTADRNGARNSARVVGQFGPYEGCIYQRTTAALASGGAGTVSSQQAVLSSSGKVSVPEQLTTVAPATNDLPLQQGSRIIGVTWDVQAGFVGSTLGHIGTATQPDLFTPGGFDATATGLGSSRAFNVDEFLQGANDNVVLTFDTPPSDNNGVLLLTVLREQIFTTAGSVPVSSGGATALEGDTVVVLNGTTLADPQTQYAGLMLRLNGEDTDYMVTAASVSGGSTYLSVDRPVRARLSGLGVTGVGAGYNAVRWEISPPGRIQIQLLPAPSVVPTIPPRYRFPALPRRISNQPDFTPEFAAEHHDLLYKGAYAEIATLLEKADAYAREIATFQNALVKYKAQDLDDISAKTSPDIDTLDSPGIGYRGAPVGTDFGRYGGGQGYY